MPAASSTAPDRHRRWLRSPPLLVALVAGACLAVAGCEEPTALPNRPSSPRLVVGATADPRAIPPTRSVAVPTTVATASATRVARLTATPTDGPTLVGGTVTPRAPTSTTAPDPGGGRAWGSTAEQPPYFSFRRPFDAASEVRGSRYYPYGTNAGGAYLLHHGIDIGNAEGTSVVAVGAGTVVHAGDDAVEAWGPSTDFYGNLVVVRHEETLDGRPLHSLYGHLSEVTVAVDQTVAAGDTLGMVGATGIALGSHLHLEFRTEARDYSATVNPELLLAPLPGHGTIVGKVVGADGARLPGELVSLYRFEGDAPDWVSTFKTYPDGPVNPAPGWGENFVFADLEEGRYGLGLGTRAVRAQEAITVEVGSVLRIVMVR